MCHSLSKVFVIMRFHTPATFNFFSFFFPLSKSLLPFGMCGVVLMIARSGSTDCQEWFY
jgi:hypothetical protein